MLICVNFCWFLSTRHISVPWLGPWDPPSNNLGSQWYFLESLSPCLTYQSHPLGHWYWLELGLDTIWMLVISSILPFLSGYWGSRCIKVKTTHGPNKMALRWTRMNGDGLQVDCKFWQLELQEGGKVMGCEKEEKSSKTVSLSLWLNGQGYMPSKKCEGAQGS